MAKLNLRGAFIPRPGYLFCSVDYDGFELRTWAQVCLWSVSHSKMAQVLNSGKDPHTELGAALAGIPTEAAYNLQGEEKKAFKENHRQVAKIANFGLPGGMGAPKFAKQAWSQYRVSLTEEHAYQVKQTWLETWPEAREYFKWVDKHVKESGVIEQYISKRVRANLEYCAACNTFFQGLAADAAKAAGWQLCKECYVDTSSPLYGSRIVNFIHDEYLLEVPESRAHEAALRQAEVMRTVAQSWVPDVQITCSPALMKRWSKGAEARYRDGRLIAWDSE